MTALYAVAGVGGLCLLVVVALLGLDVVVARREAMAGESELAEDVRGDAEVERAA